MNGKLLILLFVLLFFLTGATGSCAYFEEPSRAAKEKTVSKRKNSDDKETEREMADKRRKSANSVEKPFENERKSAQTQEKKINRVIELQPFIVNLKDKDRRCYLRLVISLGIADSVKKETNAANTVFIHKVRNALLDALSAKRSNDVLTVADKNKLRAELLAAAQAASKEFKVETIYITDFTVSRRSVF